MAKSLFTFFTAAASAEPKIKDNILHHLSLLGQEIYLTFGFASLPSLPFALLALSFVLLLLLLF